MRETVLPGAVLTRRGLQPHKGRHLPIFRGPRDTEAVRRLADHVIERHYPNWPHGAAYHALLQPWSDARLISSHAG